MTDTPDTPDTPAPFQGPGAEALIERLADGEAGVADWEAFRAAAAVEPSLWHDLAVAQRMHSELCAEVQAALAGAETVEAPVEALMTESLTRRIRVVASWGGWAAAAAVLLAWGAGMPILGGNQKAGVGPVLPAPTPQESLRSYLDRGQESGLVLGEMPTKVMIETRPAADGQGYEVIYLRQIMERTYVPDFYRMGVDDTGNPRAIRIKMSTTIPNPM
ncbi:MAG: hypothetical protein WD749_07675 [Phycisphaerales bacterium]